MYLANDPGNSLSGDLAGDLGLLGAPARDQVLYGTITRSLSVPFRASFAEFREQVRRALGRYTTFRGDSGAYLNTLLASEPTFPSTIASQHSSMSQSSPAPAENTPTAVIATFYYTAGFKKVTRITFP